jgi:hypothetical protein
MNLSPAFKEKARHEAKHFLGVFIYGWAILGLLTLHKALILGNSPFSGQIFAIINALILGKFVVILEFFGVGERFHQRPPIFRAINKSVIFGLLLFVFRFLEDELRGWFRGRTFLQTLAEMDNGKLMEMGTLAIIAIVALVPYFLLREIARAVGGQKLLTILLRPPTETTAQGG